MSVTNISEKFVPAKGNKVNCIALRVYYHKGGTNYITGGIDKRGYYLSATPTYRVDKGGYYSEECRLGSGVKKLIKEVSRQSNKAAAEAKLLAEKDEAYLIDYVCKAENVEVVDND